MSIDYTYDNLSRLIEADYNGGAVEYTYGYDLAGNLVNNNGVTNTFNPANQLTGKGTDSFEYDSNGNLWKTNSVVSHTWDKANRLLSHGGLDYAYDGLGNRISQDALTYILDVQAGLTQVIGDSTGNRYIHSPRGVHAQYDGSDWNYFLQDALGSVRSIVDVNGNILSSVNYSPVGVPDTAWEGWALTGEQRDSTGIQYHRARYYSPEMGVWINQDFLETPNRYGYVNGNVINMVDPSGLGAMPIACRQTAMGTPFLFDDAICSGIGFIEEFDNIMNGIRKGFEGVFSGSGTSLLPISTQTILSGNVLDIAREFYNYSPAPIPGELPQYGFEVGQGAIAIQPPIVRDNIDWEALARVCNSCQSALALQWLMSLLGINTSSIASTTTGEEDDDTKDNYDISLGVAEIRTSGATLNPLREFTNNLHFIYRRENIYRYEEWSFAPEMNITLAETQGSGMNLGFYKSAKDASIIHFNLEYIPNPREYAKEHGASMFGVPGTYFTAVELIQISNTPSLCDKTVFYQQGSSAPQPDYKAKIDICSEPIKLS